MTVTNIINKVRKVLEMSNAHMVIILAMLYVSCKLTCNPLFFRQITVNYPFFNIELKVLSSALLFPIIYILSDIILLMSNRLTAIFIILVGIACDGLFSFGVSYAASLPMPHEMSSTQLLNTSAINVVGGQIWQLFVHGVLATIISNIAEVLIFASIFKRIKNFFISTVVSVFIILFFHNIITDFPMMREQSDVWSIIFSGLWVNMSILVAYAAVFSLILWLKQRDFFLKLDALPQ